MSLRDTAFFQKYCLSLNILKQKKKIKLILTDRNCINILQVFFQQSIWVPNTSFSLEGLLL